METLLMETLLMETQTAETQTAEIQTAEIQTAETQTAETQTEPASPASIQRDIAVLRTAVDGLARAFKNLNTRIGELETALGALTTGETVTTQLTPLQMAVWCFMFHDNGVSSNKLAKYGVASYQRLHRLERFTKSSILSSLPVKLRNVARGEITERGLTTVFNEEGVEFAKDYFKIIEE